MPILPILSSTLSPASFLTAEGIEPAEGAFSTGFGVETEFGNFDESDDELEMRVRMDLSKFGEEPVLEIGFSAQNQGPFNFTGFAMDGTIQYLEAPLYGPVSFMQDQIVTGELTFTQLENPLHGCNNGMDDDADGWTDIDDPDCANDAVAEVGYGDTECNDGIDNNDDATMDAEDSNCDSALDNTEMTGCEDGEDNDGDGWIDYDDPDCEEGLLEVGFGDSECNDGIDNDGDGLIDADDDQCDIAIHIKEEAPPCEKQHR